MQTKFNQQFFISWRKKSELTQKEILDAINCTAFETIRNWDNGNMIPTNRMIELCQQYNMPITNFFLTDGEQTYTEYFHKHETEAVDKAVTSLLKKFERGIMDGMSASAILKRIQDGLDMTGDSPTLPSYVDEPTSTPSAEHLQPLHEMELLKLRLAHAEEVARMERKHHEEMEQYRQLIRHEQEQTEMRNQEERMRLAETIETLAQENRRLSQMAVPEHSAPYTEAKPDHAYVVMEEGKEGKSKKK